MMRPGDYDRRGPPFARGPPYGGRGGGGGGGPPFRGPDGGGGDYRDGPPGPMPRGGPGGPSGPPRERVAVDRTKTCPLLLRVFLQAGAHHRIDDFAARGKVQGARGAGRYS